MKKNPPRYTETATRPAGRVGGGAAGWVVLLGVSGCLLLLPGCSAEDYRRSADVQMDQIVRQSKNETLGYTPKTEAAVTVEAAPGKKAFAKIPFTPVPPPATSPIEPVRFEEPYAYAGPPAPPTVVLEPMPKGQVFGVDAADRLSMDRLRLGPPSPAQAPLRLDLYQAMHYAVEHSRAYRTRMEDLYLSALDVSLQRHLFEPRPFAASSLTYGGGQRDVNYQSALTAANTVGVRQQLPYGGEIVASTLVDFVQALNDNSSDGESAAVVLSGSVPLLRGAGMVNLEGLISSERQMIYQVRSFEDYRRAFAVDIAARYFRLQSLQQGVQNRKTNYVSLSNLTERTRALYSAGRLSFLEVQRSLQAQLSAENDLINAQQVYQTTLDDFKLVLGMDVNEPLQIVPVALELRVPDLDKEDYIALASKYRLDLQTARDLIDDARRGVSVAKNGLLPDLNVVAQSRIGSRVDGPASALDERTNTYSAGVRMDWALDRVAERNNYRKSLITLERAQRGFVQAQQTIISDVREAARRIRSAQISLEIQRRGIELAQRRMEFSSELMLQGKVNARDVVESQSSLLSAQDAFDVARAELQIQVLQFLRDAGLLRMDPEAGALGSAMTLNGNGAGR